MTDGDIPAWQRRRDPEEAGERFTTPEGYQLVLATPSVDMVCLRCGSTVSTYAHDLHDDWHERLEQR